MMISKEAPSIVDLLTGKALGIASQRLDLQGWVAAFRRYKYASPAERSDMELSLAHAIEQSDDWAFIADAIYLARSLRMASPAMRAAIMSKEKRVEQKFEGAIETETGRYMRDVSGGNISSGS